MVLMRRGEELDGILVNGLGSFQHFLQVGKCGVGPIILYICIQLIVLQPLK